MHRSYVVTINLLKPTGHVILKPV